MIRSARRQLVAILLSAAVLFATTVATIAVFRRDGFGVACCPAAGAGALDQPIVSELDYTLDSLPNGLRYYVRAHPSSSERTELRLVVDAGSVEETEDQRGLAHAVEHMVFRGTRSFPHGAIESYFESIGMRRGDDVNATTSVDDTEYRLTVPTTRAGAIDTAVAMLASIAHEATFDADDARREVGVLVEEWRSSRDADARVVDARHPLLLDGAQEGRELEARREDERGASGESPPDHEDAVDMEERGHGEDDVVFPAALGHVDLKQISDDIAVGQQDALR